MSKQEASKVRARVAAHRARLREQGLRPVQVWVPDVRTPEFAADAHRQSALEAASSYEAEDQAFVGAISWINDGNNDEDEE